MVNYNAPLYQHPRETWDVKKCERLAKRTARDGYGKPYPFKGYLYNGEIGHPYGGMKVRYNGGTTINGEWWQGEEWQFPILPEGFKIVSVLTTGYRIIKESNEKS